MYYYQETILVQHVRFQEKVQTQEVNRLANGISTKTSSSNDAQEINEFGETVIEIHKRVFLRENFTFPLLEDCLKILFLRKQHKEKGENCNNWWN